MNKDNRDIENRAKQSDDLSREAQPIPVTDETFQMLFEASVNVVVYVNTIGKIIKVNSAVEDMLGYTKDEVTGLHFSKLNIFRQKDVPMLMKSFKECVLAGWVKSGKNKNLDEMELQLTGKNGKEIHVSVKTSAIKKDNKLQGFLSVLTDISERKKSEAALKESELQFHTLFNQASDAIFIMSIDEGVPIIMAVNDAAVTMHGYHKDELIGKPISMLDSAESTKMIPQRIKELKETGKSRFEVTHVRKDGTMFPVEVISKIISIKGKPFILSFDRDISARKKAEYALIESEERFRTLVESTSDWIWEVDKDARYTYVSSKVEDILGYQPDEVLGKTPFDFMLPDEAERIKNVFLPFVASRESINRLENSNLHKKGHIVVLETSGVPVFNLSGDFCGYRGIDRDITDRKKAERERERLNKELEQFVYVTSHDLRSPLVNVEGYSKELEYSIKDLERVFTELELPADAMDKIHAIIHDDMSESMKYISSSIHKMEALLSGLLALSRSGSVELNITECDMNTLFADVLDAMEFQLISSGATCEISDLPSCRGDENQLNQLFSNIVGNAIKYLDPLTPGKISITGHRDKQLSVYCIEDNGIGIEPKHVRNIFEIFHQISPEHEGEGIGLNIVKKIVDRHGGDIWIESDPGRGSKFYVSLPVSKMTTDE